MKVLMVYEGIHEGHGALQALVERILGQDLFIYKPREIRQIQGKGGRLRKKALAYARQAEIDNLDGVVFLIDHDDGRDALNRVNQMAEAQEDMSIAPRIRRAFGVPVITFDAWMIADQVAIQSVLGHAIDQSPAPEELSDAKSYARSLVNNVMALRVFYEQVAANVNIETLKNRCPKGFRPFAERLEAWET